MSNWKSFLKNDTLEWLLEENNPSIRYFTLIDLFNKKSSSVEAKTAKARIMSEGPVPKILDNQEPGGYWIDPDIWYGGVARSKGSVWSFLILAELAADGNDERIKQACEYILDHTQHESGAFFPKRKLITRRQIPIFPLLPCLTGNMLFSLIRFGYLNDPRVQKGLEWIVKYQRFDDGEHWFGSKSKRPWPYYRRSCWGKHSCHRGVVRSLKALSAIPISKRSTAVKNKIKQACEHMLKHHIYKRSHDLSQVAKTDWLNLVFPYFDIDFLLILNLILKEGYIDDRMQDAIDLLKSKQNKNGRWLMERTAGNTQIQFEKQGEESKWITLRALTALKIFYN